MATIGTAGKAKNIERAEALSSTPASAPTTPVPINRKNALAVKALSEALKVFRRDTDPTTPAADKALSEALKVFRRDTDPTTPTPAPTPATLTTPKSKRGFMNMF